MPPFCIGTDANGVGDYGTHTGPLDVPEAVAADCAKAVLSAGVDVAISASMDVDHGTVQPLEKLFGDATARPVIPIFINAVATPLGPLHRCRTLGTAVGSYLATLDKRVLVMGSGGLSHDPPVPTLATADAAGRGADRARPADDTRAAAARQTAVIDAAKSFAGGRERPATAQPGVGTTNSSRSSTVAHLDDLDQVVELVRRQRGRQLRARNPHLGSGFRGAGGRRAVPDRRALLQAGPELIAGFAVRTAVPTDDGSAEQPRYVRHVVDVLVIGSGGGGMTAALTAKRSGLDDAGRRKVQPLRRFHRAVRRRHLGTRARPRSAGPATRRRPTASSTTCGSITDGLVSDARIRQYVDSAPEMMEFLEKLSPWFEFVWKPGYADYYPELPGGSELGSTINVPPIDLRKLADEEQNLLAAAGAGAARNLAGAQRTSLVLPGPAVVGRQGRLGEADLADGQGPGLRRPDGGHRPVAGRATAAGDEGPRHPAVAGLTDDAADHRRRRIGDRRGRRERRCARSGSAHGAASSWRPAASTTTWPGAKSTSRSWTRTGASATRRPPATASGPASRSAPPPTCSTRPGGFRRSNGRTAECNSCSTSG